MMKFTDGRGLISEVHEQDIAAWILKSAEDSVDYTAEVDGSYSVLFRDGSEVYFVLDVDYQDETEGYSYQWYSPSGEEDPLGGGGSIDCLLDFDQMIDEILEGK